MGSKTMSIRVDDRRERLFDRLEDATGEATRAGALEAAARYYCHMAGSGTEGAVEELMHLAVEEGNVTPDQITSVLNHPTLPVTLSVDVDVGAYDS